MTPFVTINIDAPPTLHMQATVQDLLSAAKALEQYALSISIPVTPTKPPPKGETWDDKEDLITQ